MTKVSELTGKPVISLYEAKMQGYVDCVLCDQKLKKVLYCSISGGGYDFFVPVKDIRKVSDAVTIMNDMHIAPKESISTNNCIHCPMGAGIYKTDGTFEGYLTDIEFSKTGMVTGLFSEDRILDAATVAKASDSIVITKSENNIHIRKQRKIPKLETKQVAHILNDAKRPENAEDYAFLLGRRVIKNIYSKKRKLLIRQGSTVDHKMLEHAERWMILNELTLNSIMHK